MAKTTGPLFSVDAHGSLSKILTYSRRQSGSQARKYNKPTVPPTAKQRGQRRLTEFLVAQWQNMSAGDKATWAANARTTGLNLSGYHYFLREAQKDLYTHHGLCGFWHCNEIVGGKVLDLSGQGNHGTLEPDYPSNAPVLTPSKSTRFSNGLLYDGVDDNVELGTFSLDTWSWEIWVYFNTKPGVINSGIIGNINQPRLCVGNASFDPFITTGFAKQGNGFYTGPTYMLPSLLKWYCLVCTMLNASSASPTIRLSIDGEEKDVSFPGEALFPISGIVYLNNRDGQKQVNGIYDEICMYNRVLSAAEIATRYKFATRKV